VCASMRTFTSVFGSRKVVGSSTVRSRAGASGALQRAVELAVNMYWQALYGWSVRPHDDLSWT